MNDSQQPIEPGWNHRPDDPDDLERWWTGIEWSEYTRTAGAGVAPQASATPAAPRAVAQPAAPASPVATAPSPSSPPVASTSPPAASAPPAAAPPASAPPAAAPPASAPPAAAPPATAAESDAPSAPSGPLAFAAYQGNGGAGGGEPSTGGAGGFAERFGLESDSSDSGWDRNLATMAWLPVLNLLVVLAYVLSGAQMTRHTRSHVAGLVNFAISNALMSLGITSIVLLATTSRGLAVLWMLVVAGLFGFVVYLLASSDTDNPTAAYWIWFGVWAIVALLCAATAFGSPLYAMVFGIATLSLVVLNAVRGRFGMGAKFYGYPVIPILSRR